jgi:hypothetical protein
MSKNQGKLTVLEMLKKQNSAITLAQLLSELESHYSERTLRRWLTKL